MKKRSVVTRVISLVVVLSMIMATAPPNLYALAPKSGFQKSPSARSPGEALERRLGDQGEIFEVDLGDASSYQTADAVAAVRNGKLLKFDFRNIGFAKDLPKDATSRFEQTKLTISDFAEFFQREFGQDFGDTSPFDLGYSIQELVKNAFVHGNKLDFDEPVYVEVDFSRREVRVYDVAKKSNDVRAWEQEKFQARVAELHGSSGPREPTGIAIIKNKPGWTYHRETVGDPVSGETLGTVAVVSYKRPVRARATPPREMKPVSFLDEALRAQTRLSTHRHLQKIGFRKVGGAQCPFYLWQNKYLVEVDSSGAQKGILDLYVPFASLDFAQTDVLPLSYTEEAGVGVLHVAVGKSETTATLDGQRTFSGVARETKKVQAHVPLRTRMEALGFWEIVPHSGLYGIEDAKGNFVILLDENERITFIGKPASGIVQGKNTLPVRSGVPDSSLISHSGPVLTLQNYFMQFDVGPLGFVQPDSVRLFREAAPEELGLNPAEIGEDDFVVPRAETDRVNGLPIPELEKRMRPGRNVADSGAGFIDDTERLLDQWGRDDDFVRMQGFTHRQLAFPLLYAMALWEKTGGRTKWEPLEFIYGGQKYLLRGMIPTGGYQISPFGDPHAGKNRFRITNLQTGDSISFDALVPHLIWRRHFYEGNTPYRVDPQGIIRIFFADTRAPAREREITIRSQEDIADLPRVIEENPRVERFLLKIPPSSVLPQIRQALRTNDALKKISPLRLELRMEEFSVGNYEEFERFRRAWRDSDHMDRQLLLSKIQTLRVERSWFNKFLDLPQMDARLVDKVISPDFTRNQLLQILKEKGRWHRITAPLRYVRSLAGSAAFRHRAFKDYPALRELPQDTQRHRRNVLAMYYAFVTRDFRHLHQAMPPGDRGENFFERVYTYYMERLWGRYDALSERDKAAFKEAVILGAADIPGGEMQGNLATLLGLFDLAARGQNQWPVLARESAPPDLQPPQSRQDSLDAAVSVETNP